MRYFMAALCAIVLSGSSAKATTYNVDIFGTLPTGVTQGPPGSASTNACSATTCAGGYNPTFSFEVKPGDTLNFGTLSLGAFSFGDGRQQEPTEYIDQNGQLQFGYGTPIGVYAGSLGVSFAYTPFIFLNYNPVYECNSGNPSCNPDPSSIPNQTFNLKFTLPDGFIQLGWTYPYEYTPPTSVGAVPEPSTWAMLFIGFAGIGLLAYRRKAKPALMAA